MNGLAWSNLILAAMFGVLAFATLGGIVLALTLAQVAEQLARNDENRDY